MISVKRRESVCSASCMTFHFAWCKSIVRLFRVCNVAAQVPPPANSDNIWLFDVDADPLEKNDVHAQNPDIVQKLQARIESFNATHISQVEPPIDPASNPSLTGGVWSPWVPDEEKLL